MKSRIRSVIPKKIIGINISLQKRDVISEIAKSENAEAEFLGSEVSAQQVGYLCGFKGFARCGGGAKSHCHGTQSKLDRWRAYKRAEA